MPWLTYEHIISFTPILEKLEASQASLQEAEQKISALESSLEKSVRDSDRLVEENIRAKRNFDSLQAEHDSLQERYNDVENERNKLTTQLDGTVPSDHYRKVLGELDSSNQSREAHKKRVEQLESDLAARRSELRALQGEVASVAITGHQWRLVVDDFREQIDCLNGKLAEGAKREAELQQAASADGQKLEEISAARESLEARLRDLEKKEEESTSLLQQRTEEYETNTANLLALRKADGDEIGGLREDKARLLENFNVQREHNVDKIASLRWKLHTAEKALQAEKDLHKQSASLAQEMEHKYNEAKQQLEEKTTLCDELVAKNQATVDELAKERDAQAAWQAQHKENIERLERDAQDYENLVAEKEADAAELARMQEAFYQQGDELEACRKELVTALDAAEWSRVYYESDLQQGQDAYAALETETRQLAEQLRTEQQQNQDLLSKHEFTLLMLQQEKEARERLVKNTQGLVDEVNAARESWTRFNEKCVAVIGLEKQNHQLTRQLTSLEGKLALSVQQAKRSSEYQESLRVATHRYAAAEDELFGLEISMAKLKEENEELVRELEGFEHVDYTDDDDEEDDDLVDSEEEVIEHIDQTAYDDDGLVDSEEEFIELSHDDSLLVEDALTACTRPSSRAGRDEPATETEIQQEEEGQEEEQRAKEEGEKEEQVSSSEPDTETTTLNKSATDTCKPEESTPEATTTTTTTHSGAAPEDTPSSTA